MADLACPVCGTDDIRYVKTTTETHRLTGSAPGDGKPVFVVEQEPFEVESNAIVTCVNGHAHPARVGFEIEWA
jgi:hypothetical protein